MALGVERPDRTGLPNTRDDNWAVRITRVTREISVGLLSLFLLLSFLFISLSRIAKESGCFLFDSLGLRVVEYMFLLSDDASEGQGKVSDSLSDVVLG